jgi:tetratricopeptide (TPR) repeat protein
MTGNGADIAARAKAERGAGRTAAALKRYREAAEIARREGDLLALAHRLRHIGDIHQDEGRTELAAPFYAEALILYRSAPDVPPLDLANLLRPLAMLKETIGEPEAAARAWAEAGALYAEAGVDAGVAECARRVKGLAAR